MFFKHLVSENGEKFDYFDVAAWSILLIAY
jgi:hypothetical protein